MFKEQPPNIQIIRKQQQKTYLIELIYSFSAGFVFSTTINAAINTYV